MCVIFNDDVNNLHYAQFSSLTVNISRIHSEEYLLVKYIYIYITD